MHFATIAALCVAPAHAQSDSRGGLADLSLEELANLEVTSVSRRAEPLSEAPASIYVITAQDIRRSGANSLPEILRMAPNLHVAEVNAREYAISARGFNATVANKLLVLIDGRTIYTPLFSGVFWDAQDTFLADIERIEVISGPGGTLWGANAVNGVINIITQRASGTRGTLTHVGAGNEEAGVGARHALRLSNGGGLRVYAKGISRDGTERESGGAAQDAWRRAQAGFRADWTADADALTVQGDAYDGKADQAAPGDIEISGGNLLGRWQRQLPDGDRLQVQAYFDTTFRDIPGTFAERLDTFDLEFQHALAVGGGHGLVWGGGHRRAHDRVTNTAALAFLPAKRELKWSNLFAQGDYRLGEAWRFTAGAKLEHNPYTGTELLPSMRMVRRLSEAGMAWAAASRAVRAPSRIDREFYVPGQSPFLLAGGPDFRSEISNVFELGYRGRSAALASYSITAFHSVHDHLRTLEPTPQGFVIGNQMEGESTGLEGWGELQLSPRWRLSLGATLLDQDLRLKPGSGSSGVAVAGNDPERLIKLRSSHDLGAGHELDVSVQYVGALPDPAVPSFTSIDVRYGWRPRATLELALSAQNLLDDRHAEFGTAATRSEFGRRVFLKATWRP